MGLGTRIIDATIAAFSPRAGIRRQYDRRQLSRASAIAEEIESTWRPNFGFASR